MTGYLSGEFLPDQRQVTDNRVHDATIRAFRRIHPAALHSHYLSLSLFFSLFPSFSLSLSHTCARARALSFRLFRTIRNVSGRNLELCAAEIYDCGLLFRRPTKPLPPPSCKSPCLLYCTLLVLHIYCMYKSMYRRVYIIIIIPMTAT